MQHVIYAAVCTAMHVYCTCMHCMRVYATGHKPHAIRAQTARVPPPEHSLSLVVEVGRVWYCECSACSFLEDLLQVLLVHVLTPVVGVVFFDLTISFGVCLEVQV